jgi:hypothetical protein
MLLWKARCPVSFVQQGDRNNAAIVKSYSSSGGSDSEKSTALTLPQ